jgi:hypothetical protein
MHVSSSTKQAVHQQKSESRAIHPQGKKRTTLPALPALPCIHFFSETHKNKDVQITTHINMAPSKYTRRAETAIGLGKPEGIRMPHFFQHA